MKCGLLGRGLSHSLSPLIHKKLTGCEYELFDIPDENLSAFFALADFDYISVTMPYKRAVMQFCDYISPEALRIGSVNTIINDNGVKKGYNTDYYGFSYLLTRAGITLDGKDIVVLGDGGAAAAVRAVVDDSNANSCVFLSRKGEYLISDLPSYTDAQIIINATPVGMFPNNNLCLVNPGDFPQCEAVVDLIYNPLKTKLAQRAEACNIKATCGLPMLVRQAVKTVELYKNEPISDDITEELIKMLYDRFINIVLIGMPGCGKTSVGKLLSFRFGKEFIDTDKIIENKQEMTCEDIINNDGEAHFRALEKSAVTESAKKLGCVIATGGGVVLNHENILSLKQNGLLVYIKSDINRLDTKGRPLSSDLNSLYESRHTLYEQAADITVDAGTFADETAYSISNNIIKRQGSV